MNRSKLVELTITDAKKTLLEKTNLDIKEFVELINRCMQKKPSRTDIRELRSILEKVPQLYKVVMDIGEVVQIQLIQKIVEQGAAQISMQSQTEIMRSGLGYEQSTLLEQLLIENIIICWLRLQWVEYQLSGFMDDGGSNRMSEVTYWERRLSIAQQRFLRASNSLAKIRKLTRGTVQINIASNGGQQVNVAGSVKNEK